MGLDWNWTDNTLPFVNEEGGEPAMFVLRQVADARFAIERGFIYDPAGEPITVNSQELVDTDLASIPLFMAWFVPVNGRHTPAALVHDRLVARRPDGSPPTYPRADADDVFIEAMAATDVAILRRNLMYTAVTAATRFGAGGWPRIGMLLWGLCSFIGTVALVIGSLRLAPLPVVLAALAPLPGAFFWGRRNYRQGMLAGYAVWVVLVPAIATLVGYGIYWVCEQVVRRFAARGDTPLSEIPPPAPLR